MPVTMIVHFKVKKDKQAEFSNIMDSVKIDLPSIDGCINVSIYKNMTKPQNYTLVETWGSRERHEQYVNDLIESGSWGDISALLEKEPLSDYFDVY